MWILLTVTGLALINYHLLSRKTYFKIDAGLIAFGILGFLFSHVGWDLSIAGVAIPLIFIFFSFLIFATVRVLRRSELKLLRQKTISSGRKALILCILLTVIFLWCAVIAIDPRLALYKLETRERLIQLGHVLEIYKNDHDGKYPDSLACLKPIIHNHIREIARAYGATEKEREEDYLRNEEHLLGFFEDPLDCAYEISDDTKDYTLQCPAHETYSGALRYFTYSSQKGFLIGHTLQLCTARGYYDRGVLCVDHDMQEEALAYFTKTIEIDPRFEAAYKNRGDIYCMQHNYAKAIADYTKCIEMNTGSAHVFGWRGLSYYYAGEYEKAIGDFEKTLELDPGVIYAYYFKGIACEELNLNDEALKSFRKYLELETSKYEQEKIEEVKEKIKKLQKLTIQGVIKIGEDKDTEKEH